MPDCAAAGVIPYLAAKPCQIPLVPALGEGNERADEDAPIAYARDGLSASSRSHSKLPNAAATGIWHAKRFG